MNKSKKDKAKKALIAFQFHERTLSSNYFTAQPALCILPNLKLPIADNGAEDGG